MAYTTNAATLSLAKLQENIATLSARKNRTAAENTRLKEYQQRVQELSSQNSTPPPASSGLNQNVKPEDYQTVANTLQNRVTAGTAGDGERVRLADLQSKIAAQNPAPPPPAVTPPPAPVVDPGTAPGTTTSPNASDSINAGTPGLTTEDASAIERVKALLGIGETFGRKLADEFYAPGSLGRINVGLTPEEQAALAEIKRFAGSVGNQTQQVSDLIGTQRNILTDAQQYTGNENESLNIMRAALAGLSAPEMEALRSAARDNISGQTQAIARQLAKTQARNQVFGSAASAQNRLLGQDRIRATRDLERDLIIKDVDIRAAARKDFANTVAQTEAARSNRTTAASGQLSNTILGDENNRNTAKNQANATLSSTSTTLGDRLRAMEEFNLNQGAAEVAGRIGSILGGMGTVTDQRGLIAGEEFAKKQLELSKQIQDQLMQIINKSLGKQNDILNA